MCRGGKPTVGLVRAISVTVHALSLPGVAVSPADRWDAGAALDELYAAHWRSLVRLSVLLVRDQAVAEDVVQDAFVAMHGRWHRLREPDRALAYLRQAVVNRSRSVLRHRAVVQRHVEQEGALPAEPEPGADDATVAAERRARVLDALQDLPRRQREVLALRYYADLSEAEIADTLGISRGAVKSHASRGAAALRGLLSTEELR